MSLPITLHPTVVCYPWVQLGTGSHVGAYSLLGEPTQPDSPEVAKLIIGAQAVIRSHSVVYEGNQIGARFCTSHGILIREHNTLGDDVSIGSGSVIEHHVQIGNRVRIHSQAFVPEYTVLEDDAWLGPNVVLTNARYPQTINVKENLRGPHIGTGAKLGANCTVLPGVQIGQGALIGAGAVVVKDVPAYSIVAGNPARIIRVFEPHEYNQLAIP